MKRSFPGFCVSLVCLSQCVSLAGAESYVWAEIVVTGDDGSKLQIAEVESLNDRGLVAGYTGDGVLPATGFIWNSQTAGSYFFKPDEIADAVGNEKVNSTRIRGISNGGMAVGYAAAPMDNEVGFRVELEPDGRLALKYLLVSPEKNSWLTRSVRLNAVNDKGVAVGSASASKSTRAIVQSPDQESYAFLPYLPNADLSIASDALDINGAGVIVGSIGQLPVLWDRDGQPHRIPCISRNAFGADADHVAAINRLGQMVGRTADLRENKKYVGTRPLRWDSPDGLPVELELFSISERVHDNRGDSLAINDDGVAVGFATRGSSSSESAALWNPGSTKAVDLQPLLQEPGNWTLRSAVAINQRGQIVCQARTSLGRDHWLLLTPSDE